MSHEDSFSPSSTLRSGTQSSNLFESVSTVGSSAISSDSLLAQVDSRVCGDGPYNAEPSQLSRSPEDITKYKLECRHLRTRVKQLQQECQTEQDTVTQLRRKLTNVENDRLESTTKANGEIAHLQSHLAKTRSQFEKGEALRQELEFELAKAHRETSQEKRNGSEREALMADVSDNMKQKINDLNSHIGELQQQLQEYKKMSENEEKHLRKSLEEKEKLIAQSQSDCDLRENEKEKLEGMLQERDLTIADLQDQVQQLDDEREAQGDNIRRYVNDLTYTKEREERLKSDLETALQRIKSLEESIEAERAAHLESKFNSEIIQLRVRDLEGAVDSEKAAKSEVNSAVGSLNQQLHDLEVAYAEERKMSKHTRETLDKTQTEYRQVQKQLSSEVENKKNIISNLSKQLEIHQKNFDELKEELTKAKKRQVYLEDTYGGSMRELELLLQSFEIECSGTSKRKNKDRRERSKPPSPSFLLESLRQTLGEYKKRLDSTVEELDKMKTVGKNLSKEANSYKDAIWTKEKSLEETQGSLEQTGKELSRVRNECMELEAQVASLKVDLQTVTRSYNKEKSKYQEASDEIIKLAKKYKHDDEDKTHFLHTLYQRIHSSQVFSQNVQPSFDQFSWLDVSNLVQEQVTIVTSAFHRSEDKVKHLENNLRKQEQDMAIMQQTHTEQIDKLTILAHDQEMEWQRQKQDIEDHYAQLLSEVHGRSQKSQAMVDHAWEKVRVTGSIQQGLESECAELRSFLQQTQTEASALHMACALLCGAYFPLYARVMELSAQREVLLQQLEIAEKAKNDAQNLVETLSSEMGKGENTRRHLSPILRFRICAVAVLAANRLHYFGHCSSRMFVSQEGGFKNGNALVCTGGLQKIDKPFSGIIRQRNNTQMCDGELAAVSWFASKDLLEILLSSTAELQDTILHAREQGSPAEIKLVIGAARNSFQRMMDKLGRYYTAINPGLLANNIKDRGSLIRNLKSGLANVLGHLPAERMGSIVSSKQTMSSLQHHLLEFTQRLHAAEVDRRNLRVELNEVKQDNDELQQDRVQLGRQTEENKNFRNERKNLVEVKRFESVCQELEAALKREQQAQQLLNEQSNQLHQLSRRLDTKASEGAEKDHTLSEAVQGLSDAKLEVRRKEQILKTLDHRIGQLEMEKKSLEDNVYDAEKALRTASKDKDSLANYIQTVQSAFERAKKEIGLSKDFGTGRDFSLSKILLSSELLPTDTGKLGPELVAFQSLIGSFVDAQQQTFSKMAALKDEIESHKRHVNTLKKELSAACKREYEEDVPSFRGRSVSSMTDDRDHRDQFAPLIEDTDPSYSMLKEPIDSPKRRSYRTSPTGQDSGKNSQYRTPNVSRRHPNLRPRPSDNLYR